MTKSMAKRIAAIKAMNPVNAGLLHAAHELERADLAERAAWAALQRAVIEFHRCDRLAKQRAAIDMTCVDCRSDPCKPGCDGGR